MSSPKITQDAKLPARTGWGQALSVFADRRAVIMFFLGFSAGIPILLIFSSLSLWLGEADINKSVVTMFSWAALGYSFKFVWAPLIDEIPLPYLTKKLGRRRAWLLVAQVFIICAIVIMAMSDPAQGRASLIQLAAGAVLLGFSSATQDIVIDAYRIELAETKMQAVLASTYNAGYRIGMIVAGAGALFIAAALGTDVGNYIYQAWQYTYLIMAAVMLIGVATTLSIREPVVNRVYRQYKRLDYLRLVLVFFCAVASFVASFIVLAHWLEQFKVDDPFLSFLMEAVRFIGSAAIAFAVGMLLVKLGTVNKQMAVETWVAPIRDFFKRYGVKLALVLLLLIGFFRISDILAGVISNIFYQDMNFSKERIAEAVKLYGVLFTLVGGFLGGLLSQRFKIIKVLFIGAVLASSTNLIFIGLVKSGVATSDVMIAVGQQKYQAQTDEVGFWPVDVPAQVLMQARALDATVSYKNPGYENQGYQVQRQLPYLQRDAQQSVQLQMLPVSHDGVLYSHEIGQKIVVEGQLLGLSAQQLQANDQVELEVAQEKYMAKVDSKGHFGVAIPGEVLIKAPQPQISAIYALTDDRLLSQATYRVLNDKAPKQQLDNLLQPLPLIDPSQDHYTVSGKVVKEYSAVWLYFAIIVDNLASGLAGAAFIAFLSSLTSVSFTAVQYAIFSSLMTLTPKIIGGYSGTIVTAIGYPKFFLMTALVGIPVLILIVWVGKLLRQHEQAT